MSIPAAAGRDRRLVLLRHGRTAYNASGRFQGKLDPPLDDFGRGQAGVAAEAIAARCGLTAALDERLTEVDNGRWAGLTLAEVRERYPDEHAGWRRGDDIKIGGGESYWEVSERAMAAVTEPLAALDDDGLLVVVDAPRRCPRRCARCSAPRR